MGLRNLADAGVADLLDAAADVVVRRGLAKGLRIDPTDGSVDLVAAVSLALGAKERDLLSSVSLTDTGVPAATEAVLHAALDVLDAFRPEVETWADHPATGSVEVERLLRQAAMRLRIAVV
jgi:hypothetical protein